MNVLNEKKLNTFLKEHSKSVPEDSSFAARKIYNSFHTHKNTKSHPWLRTIGLKLVLPSVLSLMLVFYCVQNKNLQNSEDELNDISVSSYQLDNNSFGDEWLQISDLVSQEP